jgi:hypothetical protein
MLKLEVNCPVDLKSTGILDGTLNSAPTDLLIMHETSVSIRVNIPCQYLINDTHFSECVRM